jgi:hypothetical protein
VLTTDASNEALGAILSQGPIGRDLPIVYISRTPNNAERNYSTTETELLAIDWIFKQFKQCLLGRKFTMVTDHKPLTRVFNVNDPSSRLLRWRLKLDDFDYDIIYKPGVKNTNADALSSVNITEVSPVKAADSTPTKEEREIFLQEFLQLPTGRHLGMNRTFERIELYTSWTGIKHEIENYVKHCEICQKNKLTQRKTKLPLQITDTPEIVWGKCSLGSVGPLTQTSRDNRYLLTLQDELSKFTVATPIPQQDATTVAKVFVEEIILKFGIPQVILTDQGSNFLSNLFANVCKLLRIIRIKTRSFHPQTNRSFERTHRVLVQYLRCYILVDQIDWDLWISYATFVFNTTPYSSTGFTPHELLFGRKPNTPGVLQKDPPEIMIMTITYKNFSPDCKHAMRQRDPIG